MEERIDRLMMALPELDNKIWLGYLKGEGTLRLNVEGLEDFQWLELERTLKNYMGAGVVTRVENPDEKEVVIIFKGDDKGQD